MSISGEEMKITTCEDIPDEDCLAPMCDNCPAYGNVKREEKS